MLKINDDKVAIDEVFVFEKLYGSISNFCGERLRYSDLSKCKFVYEESRLDYFLELINYIAGIHTKNFFHGDIKPENIFFSN